MARGICTQDQCEEFVYGHGLCATHYHQAKRRKELPSSKLCSYDGCDNPYFGNGYCGGHNYQLKNGKTLQPLLHTLSEEEKFWRRVRKGKPDECWEFTGYRNRKGYGRGNYKGRMWLSHRAAYTIAYGPIPDGAQVDHMCWNRGCVNPGHLRFATNAQNGQNRKGASRNSTTGVRGVSINRKYGNYQAKVYNEGEQISLGYYETVAEAEKVVVAWRREHWPYSLMDQKGADDAP